MTCLIAIGGGSLKLQETLSFDRLIVERTNKAFPKALYLSLGFNAVNEEETSFNAVYGGILGCETDVVSVMDEELNLSHLKEKLNWADLIYIGDPQSPLDASIRVLDALSPALKKAWSKGTIIGGVGFGARYWFKGEWLESLDDGPKKTLKRTFLKGLNCYEAYYCSRFELDNRSSAFSEWIQSTDEIGIGVDSTCALEFLGDYYRIHQTGKGYAYKLLKEDGIVYKEILNNTTAYLPTESLLSKKSLFMHLTDGTIDLILSERQPENIKIGYVPYMKYHMCLHGSEEVIGIIDIRLGNNENTFYGGHIGYEVFESFRGCGYASRGVELIQRVGWAYGYRELIITCNPDNLASRKTAERAGAVFIEQVNIPEYQDMYLLGEREKCRYRLANPK